MVVMVGRRWVVQGSGAAVLDRLSWARLKGLLQLCHVVGVLDTQTHTNLQNKASEKSQIRGESKEKSKAE